MNKIQTHNFIAIQRVTPTISFLNIKTGKENYVLRYEYITIPRQKYKFVQDDEQFKKWFITSYFLP